MLSKEVYKDFEKAIVSDGFKVIEQGVLRSFSNDEDFSYWVFSGGANLYSDIKALEDKDSMIELVTMINDIFKDNLSKEELKTLKKDKTSFKFISKWMESLGQKQSDNAKLQHLSSSKRNTYATFLCLLLQYTNIEDDSQDDSAASDTAEGLTVEPLTDEILDIA